jgi:hypothetical protein
MLLLKLVEKTSKAGNLYLTGTLGGLRIHAFRSKADPAIWNAYIRHERKKKTATEAAAVEDSGGGE